MAKKKNENNDEAPAETVNDESAGEVTTAPEPSIKKGDRFVFKRSKTLVEVTLVREDGTIDIQEPDSPRAWTAVSRDQLVDAPE